MSSYLTTSAAASTYYPLTGNPSGFITSSALTPYLTSATAASTYQTLSGMSSYLTTSSAASTYYPLSNPSGYIDSSALTGYATESWVTSQGYLTDAPSDSNQYVRLNGAWSALSVPADYITSVTSPLSVTSGDLSIDLTGYATESYVTSQGYITSSALSPYLTSATAASTYQTISGMNAYAPLASPALTGNPTAPTPATGDDDTSIATTAFVKAQGYLTTAPVTSVAGKTGAVTLVVADVSGAAPLASPTFTGTPAAPTATAGTSTTQLATTAFVTTADNLKANLASPTFTGTPAAPTATAGTSTTQIATTAFVTTADNLKANLASPAFTGTPTAPTATAGTNTTQIATTAFVTSAVPAIASITDSRQLTNTTKAMSPNDVLWAIQTQDYININRAGFTYTTSGTPQYNDVGSVTTRTRLNATGASSVIGRPFGVSQVDQSSPFLFRNNWTSNINFNLKTYLSGRTGTFALFTDATFNVAFYYGKVEGDAIGDLTRRGYGWKFTGGAGTRYVTLQVHNGTTLTNVTSSFAPTQEVAFDWDIYSDGVGNVTLYINGSQVATSNAGPTSYQSAGTYAWWREETWTTGAPSFGNHTSYFTRGRAIILNY
jgi:hypothetical protein